MNTKQEQSPRRLFQWWINLMQWVYGGAAEDKPCGCSDKKALPEVTPSKPARSGQALWAKRDELGVAVLGELFDAFPELGPGPLGSAHPGVEVGDYVILAIEDDKGAQELQGGLVVKASSSGQVVRVQPPKSALLGDAVEGFRVGDLVPLELSQILHAMEMPSPHDPARVLESDEKVGPLLPEVPYHLRHGERALQSPKWTASGSPSTIRWGPTWNRDGASYTEIMVAPSFDGAEVRLLDAALGDVRVGAWTLPPV